MKCTWPSLFFLFSNFPITSSFLFSLLTFLFLFLKPQPTYAIMVQCDGSENHIDVDYVQLNMPEKTLDPV